MSAKMIALHTSATVGKSGDIYQFEINSFWRGSWVKSQDKSNNDLIGISRKEYLLISADIPSSGCITLHQESHAALYKILLARQYPHFGVTGIKSVYLILCLDGYFGSKYRKITSQESIRKLIGGRADCSHASQEFWEVCVSRITQIDISERLSLSSSTQKEREIWRSFVRRASISCNRKKLKKEEK